MAPAKWPSSKQPHPFTVLLGLVLFLWTGTYITKYSLRFWREYGNSKPAPGSVLAEGIVVKRGYIQISSSIRRPVLDIQLSNEGTTIRAVLGIDGSKDIPDRVHFYYSGDPQKEVFLLEEGNPLWLALLFSFAAVFAYSFPIAFVTVRVVALKKQRDKIRR